MIKRDKFDKDKERDCVKKLMALFLILVHVFVLSSCKTNEQVEREKISDYAVATFEYVEDIGYKLITSEIDSLDTFDSLLLKPSDTKFDGNWIYRITFNPTEYSMNTEEVVILFGEKSVSINGKTYIGDGVSYSEILNWASGKYVFLIMNLLQIK